MTCISHAGCFIFPGRNAQDSIITLLTNLCIRFDSNPAQSTHVQQISPKCKQVINALAETDSDFLARWKSIWSNRGEKKTALCNWVVMGARHAGWRGGGWWVPQGTVFVHPPVFSPQTSCTFDKWVQLLGTLFYSGINVPGTDQTVSTA